MRVVHFADLHLDAPFVSTGREAAPRRRQRLREVLTRIAHLAAEVKADALFCAGDLYEDQRITPDTAEFVRRTFEELQPMRVFLAPGNHDWHGPQSLYARVAWPANVHVFRKSRLEPIELADGLTLWGGAHCAPANTDNFLDSFRVDRGGVHIGLFHASERRGLMFQGDGKLPHAAFDVADLERSGIHHAFLGHYHVPDDSDRYTYPGNPEPLSFGESGQRGPVVAMIGSDGGVARERRNVSITRVADVEVDVTGSKTRKDVLDLVKGAINGLQGAVRVSLSGDLDSGVDFSAGDVERPETLESLVVRAEAIGVAYDYEAIAKEPTVRGQFVRDVRNGSGSALTADERRRVLVTGLRALEGRSDLEVS